MAVRDQRRTAFEVEMERALRLAVVLVCALAVPSAALARPPAAKSPEAAARCYVAIGAVTDRNGAGADEVAPSVQRWLREVLSTQAHVEVAPADEPLRKSNAVAKKRRGKGLLVMTNVAPFVYADNGLTVNVELVVFGLPGMTMQGGYAVSATLPGVQAVDRKAELELVKTATERLGEKVAARALEP